MNTFEFRAMTTDIMLAADGDPAMVNEGFEVVTRWIKACEQRFTRFTDTSELAGLNRSEGRWYPVSQDMFELLTDAYLLVDQTNGIFDPSILPDLEKAGYTRSIEEIRAQDIGLQKPTHQTRSRINSGFNQRPVSFTSIRLDPKDQSVRLQPGMRIDLGGIAKGWIAEKAAYKLAAFSDAAAVDIGGDMFLIGQPKDEPLWRVGLEDPKVPSNDLAVLHARSPIAIATSSIVKRRWLQAEEIRHHLIDPRWGEPAETDWLSVTAIAPHGTQAEAFAKALLIAGSKEASQIVEGLPTLAYIAVDENGTLWGSENSKEYLYVAEKLPTNR